MTSIGTGYDLSASQFSPDGRVFQVEYAMKAVENSSTAIGIKCTDGVVLAVEKLVQSKLYESSSNQRIFNIDLHIGMAIAGLLTDARELVEFARNEAANYKSEYQMPIPLKYLVERVSSYMHVFTLYGAVRPFGASVLLASYLEDSPQLFCVEPSGISVGYNGTAIGKARQNAKTEIEKLKFSELTCKDALLEAAKVIHGVHDEVKDKQFQLQMSWVGTNTNGRHTKVEQGLLNEAETKAKELLEDSDSDDE